MSSSMREPDCSYTIALTLPSREKDSPVTTARGTTSTPKTLVLEKGVYLKMRVSDPVGLLPQVVDGPWTPRKLLVGV